MVHACVANEIGNEEFIFGMKQINLRLLSMLITREDCGEIARCRRLND